MKLTTVLTGIPALVGLIALSAVATASADIIASQDFGSANFPADLDLDTQDNAVVTHAGSGASGTDLGFSANGIGSTSGGNNPSFKVTGGQVEFIHFSSLSDVSTLASTDALSGASTVTFAQGTDHTAFLYTEVVDLSGFTAKSFSMEVGDIVGATNTGDDDILVRLWINGDTEVVLVDTRGNGSGALPFGPITHAFADSDTSAQLLVDLFSDDDNDGYRIDNILFEGTPIAVDPVTIAAQDFGAENFPADLDLDTQDDAVVTHAGSGATGTDLGFSANGIGSASSGNNPSFKVAGGQVEFIHFSSGSDVSILASTDLLSTAPVVTFDQFTDHTAYLYTEVVDLTAFDSATFSMEVGDIVGATNTGDDDILVRLWINDTTEVVLVDTRGNGSGGLTFGTISYAFADSDTSAQLLVDLFSDDDNDGYRIDSILFAGVPVPPSVIAAQDFGAANFPADLDLDTQDNTVVTHAGSGASGTDLGFSANGIGSTTSGNTPSFKVTGGEVEFIHFSSLSDVSTLASTEALSGAPTVTFAQGTDHTAFLYTEVVDLSGFIAPTFSMEVGDIVDATNTGDDDILVRLWINDDTEVTLIDTRGNGTGALPFETITYAFESTDKTAQLLVDLFTDDNNDGYRIDSIVFAGYPASGAITTRFQEGFDDYASTADTIVRSGVPTASSSDVTELSIDGADDGGLNQGLIRFDDIIGGAPNQVPGGSTILSATLRVFVFNPGSGFSVHTMLSPWNETDSWADLGNGVQTDGIEAAGTPLVTYGANNSAENIGTGDFAIDVTAAVQAWANGEDNNGIVLVPFPAGTNGIDFDSSESSFTTDRPELIVTYAPGANQAPTVSLTAPIDGSVQDPPANFVLVAEATDVDGTIDRVEFFVGEEFIAADSEAPYTVTLTDVLLGGDYTLTAVAYDDLQASAVSEPVTVTVTVDPAPEVALVGPEDGATGLGTGGTVTLEVQVSDPEDQPLTVTFFGRAKNPPPGPDFTLVAIPDTQNYTDINQADRNLPNFISQTQWIVSAKDALNIAFVSHLGDVAQNYNREEQEYINADQAMVIIEDPFTTLLEDGIPWGVTPGNHDIGSGQNTTLFNQYFGISRFQDRAYYQGNYGANNDNNYQYFSASGLDFIVVNVKYNAGIVEPAIIDWADAVLKAHPNRRAIVTSHNFLTAGNPAPWHGHGQIVYEALRDNPNLFMMLCGHRQEEGIRIETYEGNTVYVLLSDYQGRPGGGGGWLRYYEFSPANDTITARTYQTTTGLFETDANSEFTLPYDMGQSLAPWAEIGTFVLPAGENSASVDWMNLAPETEYEWYAAVSDGITPVATTVRSFTTTTNAAPSVSLDAPLDGSVIELPATVDFAATASDTDGTVASVEFYANDILVGEDSTAPYTFSWTTPSGSYTLTALAIDNQGTTTSSSAVEVTVTNPNNSAPAVELIQPVNGTALFAGTTLLSANASDTDGFITQVEFFIDGSSLGTVTEAPYELPWLADQIGKFLVTAVATDNDGGSATSLGSGVTVAPVSTVAFRTDLDGYGSAEDTQIREANATSTYSNATSLSVDASDGGGRNHILMRFGDLLGEGALQVPAGSTITSATLTLRIINPGSGFDVHQLLQSWDDTATWAGAFGSDGIQPNDTEASSTVIASLRNIPTGNLNIDVTALVQAWSDGATNYGFALLPAPGGDGVDFRTSEYTGNVTQRPTLTIEYGTPISYTDFFIHEIQGETDLPDGTVIGGAGFADASPCLDQSVRVQAIVTAVFQGTGSLGGFYIQEEDGDVDSNPFTSEGLFVFSDTTVAVGDLVTVEGVVSEFEGETQLVADAVVIDSRGNALPEPVAVTLPTATVLVDTDGSFVANLEAYEGMRVKIAQPLSVTELFTLGRFGTFRISAEGRLEQFTQNAAPDTVGFEQHLADIAKRSLVLDDGLDVQNPDTLFVAGLGLDETLDAGDAFRMGDTYTDLIGIVSYSEDDQSSSQEPEYRLHRATGVLEAMNPTPAQPEDVGGSLQVAAFNVLNFFTTLDTFPVREAVGPNSDSPRGADTNPQAARPGAGATDEYDRQLAKLTAALVTIDADIVGLIEIENDFLKDGGTRPTPASAQDPRDIAIEELVLAVNALSSRTYAWVSPGAGEEFVGTDPIAVGFMYDTATVALAGGAQVLDTPDFLDPNGSGEDRNRAALAQTFVETASGEVLTIAVNHFKSKGDSGLDDDPAISPTDVDMRDGQGFWNATRTAAAKALVDWLATDPTSSGDTDVLILGDLNAYLIEDPIQAVLDGADDTRGTGDDYVNLIADTDASYTFVFDGQAGTLDYALANTSLADQVTGATEWHINADEPSVLDYNLEFNRDPSLFTADAFRSSDHDPVIIGLDLGATVALPGDLNGDGSVDMGDRSVMLAAFGSRVGDANYLPEADLDGDGVIGMLDYRLWFAAYRMFTSGL